MTEIRREIRPLVGIRGPATLWVVLFHLYPVMLHLFSRPRPWYDYLASSTLAVDFFFMLSGFVIAHTYLDSMRVFSRETSRHYLALRFARIFPLHIAMVIAFVAYDKIAKELIGFGLSAHNVGPLNVVMNLAMVQEFPPGEAINPPAWSLAPEFGAYLLFPFLAVLLCRIRSPRAAFAGAAVLLCGGAFLMSRVYDGFGPNGGGYTAAWVRIAVGFMSGCLLNVGWRHLGPRAKHSSRWDVVAVLSLVFVAVIVARTAHHGEFRVPVAGMPFLGLLVLACAGATGHVAALLGSRIVEWSGRVSYSVYMTHFLVIIVVNYFVVSRHMETLPDLMRLVVLLLTLVAIAVVGVATYAWVEEPSRKLIRRLERRRIATHPDG